VTNQPSDNRRALTLQVESRGPDVLLRVCGTVDLATLDALTGALCLVETQVASAAVVDLTRTEFLACCAIRPLASLRAALEATQRHLVLAGARGIVRRVLLACDLREVLADTTAGRTGPQAPRLPSSPVVAPAKPSGRGAAGSAAHVARGPIQAAPV
jgi:anti-anti-sigma factor